MGILLLITPFTFLFFLCSEETNFLKMMVVEEISCNLLCHSVISAHMLHPVSFSFISVCHSTFHTCVAYVSHSVSCVVSPPVIQILSIKSIPFLVNLQKEN